MDLDICHQHFFQKRRSIWIDEKKQRKHNALRRTSSVTVQAAIHRSDKHTYSASSDVVGSYSRKVVESSS